MKKWKMNCNKNGTGFLQGANHSWLTRQPRTQPIGYQSRNLLALEHITVKTRVRNQRKAIATIKYSSKVAEQISRIWWEWVRPTWSPRKTYIQISKCSIQFIERILFSQNRLEMLWKLIRTCRTQERKDQKHQCQLMAKTSKASWINRLKAITANNNKINWLLIRWTHLLTRLSTPSSSSLWSKLTPHLKSSFFTTWPAVTKDCTSMMNARST